MAEFDETTPTLPPLSGLTSRAVTTGVVAVALVSVMVTWAELVLSSVRIGYLQLPPVAIAMLLTVLGASSVAGRVLGARFRYSAAELVTVYVMAVAGAMVASHGVLQKLIPLLVVPNYAANRSNNWAQLLFPPTPHWLVAWDPNQGAKQDVSKYFFEHLPHGGEIPWSNWLAPLAAWSVFLGAILWAFVCLSVILRRQWVDNEKLAFPLAQLPLDIIQERDSGNGKSFWRNSATWIGIAIPVAVYGVDWLHQFFPTMPMIATSVTLNDYLTGAGSPWNQLDYTPLIFTFAALGFFYLLPTDILFSIWFFFLMRRFEQMIAVTANMDTPRMPMQNVYLFQGYQTVAAYLVMVGYLVWIARPHLRQVWGEAIRRLGPSDEGREMLSYRAALWGLIGALLVAGVFLVVAGMSPLFVALELVGAVLVIGLVMARSTAEAGLLMTEVTWSPIDVYAMFANIHTLGTGNLTVGPYVDHLIVHDQRGLLLTGMLDSSRLAGGARLKPRALLAALVIGIAVALAVAEPLQIWLPYTYGGQNMDYWMESLSPQSQFTRFSQGLAPGGSALKDAWQAPVFFVVGGAVTAFLVVMRSHFYWWPLHPLGYVLAGSWSTIQFWFPCLIAWILKSTSIRYGGMAFYAKARPFFLGLIIGEFGMAVVTATVSAIVFQASHHRYTLPTPPFPWQ